MCCYLIRGCVALQFASTILLSTAVTQADDTIAPSDKRTDSLNDPFAPNPGRTKQEKRDRFAAPPSKPRDETIEKNQARPERPPLLEPDGDGSLKQVRRRLTERERRLLAEVEAELLKLKQQAAKATANAPHAAKMNKQRAERIETLGELTRVYWKEFKQGKRSIQQVIATAEQLTTAQLEAKELQSDRVTIREKHKHRLQLMESDLKKLVDLKTAQHGDYLACVAARQKAEIDLARGDFAPADKLEQLTLESLVESARATFRKTDAKFRAGLRGGDEAEQALAGFVLYRARADLALAQGDPQSALREMKMACSFAHRGVQCIGAKFNVGAGNVSLELLLKAKVSRQKAFRNYLQLERRVGMPNEAIPAKVSETPK